MRRLLRLGFGEHLVHPLKTQCAQGEMGQRWAEMRRQCLGGKGGLG